MKIEQIINNPNVSGWLKNSLTTALDRDPVDAAHDARFLSMILSAQAEIVLKNAVIKTKKNGQ